MRKWLSYLLVILSCVSSVWAQEAGQPVASVNGEYIKEWLVIGPFFPDYIDKDFLADAGGEANIDPKAGDIVTTGDGRTLTWKRYKSETNLIHIIKAIGYSNNSIAYAFCILKPDTAGEFMLRIGSEDGVVAWVNGQQVGYRNWGRDFTFDSGFDEVKLNLLATANRFLIKTSRGGGPWYFGVQSYPESRGEISGVIRYENGKPVSEGSVCLKQSDKQVARTKVDASGSYLLAIYPVNGLYDLTAVSGESGNWKLAFPLNAGERLNIDLILRNAISIEGALLSLDDETPHIAAAVDAVCDGVVAATVLSDQDGEYRFVNLRPGNYQVRCHLADGYIYYASSSDENMTGGEATKKTESKTLINVSPGITVSDIDFRFAPSKKGGWRSYDTLYGLADKHILSIHQDESGAMWFGTDGGGASYFDGGEFINFTKRDGLANNTVNAINSGPGGAIWFGTDKGISRYYAGEVSNYTEDNGLANNIVNSIYCEPDGIIWFGTSNGVSRYNGLEFTNFTVEDGLPHNYISAISGTPDGAVWFGTNGGGVSHYDGQSFTNLTMEDGLIEDVITSVYCASDGSMWFGTWRYDSSGGVSRYDGNRFINLTGQGGLTHQNIRSIYQDSDGNMWFGTDNGVTRYNGKTFINFSRKDGLTGNSVYAISGDSDGAIWFGTDSGISRYDRNALINFTTRDGLVNDNVISSYCAPGVMWFGTDEHGLSRYDGHTFVNFIKPWSRSLEGKPLGDCNAYDIYGDQRGFLWFALSNIGGDGGISRYDGEHFINFTVADGVLVSRGWVNRIDGGIDGSVWFSTLNGATRYNGKEFISFTEQDGLPGRSVTDVYSHSDGTTWFALPYAKEKNLASYDGEGFSTFSTEDAFGVSSVIAIGGGQDGAIWFGTSGDGVIRYCEDGFVNLTTADGLANDFVFIIHRGVDDIMWFGTSAGVSYYDGIAWASLDQRDGLAGNVSTIHQEQDGTMWFGTDNGITRYRRGDTPPKVHITSVQIPGVSYTDLGAIPPITTGEYVTIECSSIDLKTLPEKRQYRYRIQSSAKDPSRKLMDLDWLKPVKSAQFFWTPDKSGAYTFQVQAIDRDLNYSEPASLKLTVISPLYLRAAFLIPTIGSGALLLTALVIMAAVLVKRRTQIHEYERMAVQELQDAREMQKSLLPEAAPVIEGMKIAGKSITANTVGGDFFDYLTLVDGKVGIAIGDVSGKGLKAAMNAVLASGMLYEVVKTEASCGNILSVMNAGLYPRTEKQMFTAFSFAILDTDAGVIHWANAGQPLPLIKRGKAASEVIEDGQLPLGMMPDVVYPDCQLELQSGDTVIFYTDGIIEAENEAEEMYGTERLIKLVSGMDVAASAEDVIQAILRDVSSFVGNAEQYDDMTIVVVKRLGNGNAS